MKKRLDHLERKDRQRRASEDEKRKEKERIDTIMHHIKMSMEQAEKKKQWKNALRTIYVNNFFFCIVCI